MKHHSSSQVLPILGTVLAACLLFCSAGAAAQQISAHVNCSALSVTPQTWPAYSYELAFTRSGTTLTATRTTTARPGREAYRGSIDAKGGVKVSGSGSYTDGYSAWKLNFASGPVNASGGAALSGGMRDKFGNTRTCTMTFQSGLR